MPDRGHVTLLNLVSIILFGIGCLAFFTAMMQNESSQQITNAVLCSVILGVGLFLLAGMTQVCRYFHQLRCDLHSGQAKDDAQKPFTPHGRM